MEKFIKAAKEKEIVNGFNLQLFFGFCFSCLKKQKAERKRRRFEGKPSISL